MLFSRIHPERSGISQRGVGIRKRVRASQTKHTTTTTPSWKLESASASFLPRLKVCLVHFAKICKDVNKAFEVLNEVYL